jgi:hypothetical protein
VIRLQGGQSEGQRFDSGQGKKFISPSNCADRLLEHTKPPFQWVTRTLSAGLKWPKHEADSFSSTEAKSEWIHTSVSSHDLGVQRYGMKMSGRHVPVALPTVKGTSWLGGAQS